ncbi:putative G-actin binding protein, putative,CAP/Srv2p [Trypanosoma theileri]|uniref:Putative G-actin binding protein, putative,CAP/Srv2p n=1 Tax=Trypanosoma theileri TaxID=67003 RepID=A0A1X0P0T3_9TRYP|nr:putative G-actin binding protein, putative,CAP/Srv2p [Trypanosoma theileri]ORC90323.1 putative G-actin binding protein, putative,CAP/Srv2p [Trypanosoma theileri]
MFACCSASHSTAETKSNKPNGPNKMPPPPPPPPPPKPTNNTDGSNTVGGAASALFAEIQGAGDNITARLRHVTDDQKTYKQNVRHGELDFSKLDAKKAEAEARRQQQQPAKSAEVEAPVLQLEGDKRWAVKHQKGTSNEPKRITLDKVNMRHAVQIHNCEYVMVEITGKVNSVSLVACSRVHVVLDSVVASLEVLKSNDIEVRVRRAVPTAAVEKSTSVTLCLLDRSAALETSIVTACSTAVNVSVPESDKSDADLVERPVPEQFVSHVVRDKRGGYAIETKPAEGV